MNRKTEVTNTWKVNEGITVYHFDDPDELNYHDKVVLDVKDPYDSETGRAVMTTQETIELIEVLKQALVRAQECRMEKQSAAQGEG